MDKVAIELSTEFGAARNSVAKALNHALELVNLLLEDFDTDIDEARSSWADTLDTLQANIATTRAQFSTFRQSIQNMPRISKRLNSARKNLLQALDEFEALLDLTISNALAIRTRLNAAIS